MKSPELYEAARAYSIKALELLRNYVPIQGLPQNEIEHITSIEWEETRQSFRTEIELILDFSNLIHDHERELRELPEATRCVDVMRRDPAAAKYHNKEQLLEALRYFVSYMARLSKSLEFDALVFGKLYGRLEQDILSSSYGIYAYTALVRFKCQDELIELGDGLRIRKATLEELSQIWRSRETYGSLQLLFPPENIIEFTHESSKGQALDPTPVLDKFGDIVGALRIFTNCSVRHTAIFERLPLTFFGGGIVSLPGPSEYQISGPDCNLQHRDVERFLEFWKLYGNVSQSNYIKRALKRFNTAIVSQDIEDKVVDLAIAFETLFRTHGYRLSHYVSALTERTPSERKDTAHFMDTAYIARSTVAHGGGLGTYLQRKGLVPLEFVQKLQELTRKCIKISIALNQANQMHFLETLHNLSFDEKAQDQLRGSLPNWAFQ